MDNHKVEVKITSPNGEVTEMEGTSAVFCLVEGNRVSSGMVGAWDMQNMSQVYKIISRTLEDAGAELLDSLADSLKDEVKSRNN